MFELSIDGAIARLRLARPEARNAIRLEGWRSLGDRAEEAVRLGASVLIVSGDPGGAFCAGADLATFGRFRDEPAARTEFRLAIRDGLDRLGQLEIPAIALVEGACYGAGVALAIACDIRVASPAAQFAITPAKLGISYPQEDVHRLVTLVGAGQAARLMLSAGRVDGREAERIGLVEICTDSAAVEADKLAQAIAANELQSLKTLKRAIRLAGRGIRQDDAQDRLFDDLLGSDPLFERLSLYSKAPK